MNATNEVFTAITNIQNYVKESAQVSEKVWTLTEQSTHLADDSGKKLTYILAISGKVWENMIGIATTTRNQFTHSAQVAEKMNTISTQANNTSIKMKESTQYVSALYDLSAKLKLLIDNMMHERRQEERYAIKDPCPLDITTGDNKVFSGNLNDISLHGARVSLPSHMTLQSKASYV